MKRSQATKSEALADALHSAAIRLLRRLRKEDAAIGVSGPQLSALSVLTFAGPQTLSALARVEQVRLPTMSRLVSDLVRAGLAERTASKEDRRTAIVAATAKGRALLHEGRRLRLASLTHALETLAPDECRALARAAELMEKLARE
ncbi:MAG: MarR family winged helix-turn-helix transcriptional regulator [Alphaproteobacteria bacterium]